MARTRIGIPVAATIIAVAYALCAVPASAQPTSYDGFANGPLANLAGSNGGTGWTSTWTNTGSNLTSIQTPGLNYPGLATTAGGATGPAAKRSCGTSPSSVHSCMPARHTSDRSVTRRARTANGEKLRSILARIFAGDLRDNWVARMKAANVPVGYLRTIEQAFNAPEVRERHRLSQIPHPTAGTVPNIEPPLRLALTPVTDPVAAPVLGEHTREVLRKTLGYDDARIAALEGAGAFGKIPGNV